MPAVPGRARENLAATVSVTLKNGRTVTREVTEFMGTPARPLDRAGMQEKFLLLTKHFPRDKMQRVFDRIQNLENEKTLDWLSV
mgnify:FL=1